MDSTAELQSLEWHSLLRHYSAHCLSAPAKEGALTLEPAESVSEAELRLEYTAQAVKALDRYTFPSLSSLDTLEPILERLVRSAVLDGKELLRLARCAQISGELRSQLCAPAEKSNFPLLVEMANTIPTLNAQADMVLRAIDEHGQVRDSASPALRSLRDQERRLHAEARERLDVVLQQAFRDGYLQDKFYDFRDGRYLIPVKSEFKNRVNGYVVESSSTRATVFMEPSAVRDSNDRLKQTNLLIEEEIYRILDELSHNLHPHAEAFKHAYEITVELDLILARGAFAKEYGSLKGVSRPSFQDFFDLEELYHPLLAFVIGVDRVIRNSFRLGPEKRVLVISGPNTGGKTVLLKAVGLSCMMARSGFFLPCNGRAILPFFNRVLAQIGDSQNLELSLSSFSGSVLHLKEMLEGANGRSLVLVDEILHATDPDEATALSRAILEELQRRGAYALVTTHLNGLKVGGESAFESASMEFDLEKLSPTYRFRIGVPGSSRALEIALKLGLSENVVAAARNFLSAEKLEEQSAVDQLEARERELEAAKRELEATKLQLEGERSQFAKLNVDLESHKKTFRAEALAKLREQQRSTLQEVENLIGSYKKKLQSIEEKHSAAVEAQSETEKVRAGFREIEKALDAIAPIPVVIPPPLEQVVHPKGELQKNGEVRILSMGNDGILLSDPADRSKPAEVMIGRMRLKVAWDQIEKKEGKRTFSTHSARQIRTTSDEPEVQSELYLIGKTVDEASDMLAMYIDRAARSGKPFVRIVHGHGSGVLRKAIRDFLKKSRYDMKFRAGTAQEGGEGCTVIEFV